MFHQHKKIFLWGDEANYFCYGNSLQTLRWNTTTIGISICFDIELPESVRKFAMEGADVIFCVSAAMDCPNVSDVMILTRAIENHVL